MTIYIVQAGLEHASACYLRCFTSKTDADKHAVKIKEQENFDYAIVHERQVY